MFTQTPIEGAIWTYFVSIQQWIVTNIILTPLFKASVATWIGFLFIKCVYNMSKSHHAGAVFGKFIFSLCIAAIGFSLLKTRSSEPFRSLNAVGKTWDSHQKTRDSQKYSGLFSDTSGLYFYVKIHGGVNQISSFVSAKIGELFKDTNHQKSPYLLIQTLAQTASQTIDDPKAMASMNWLFENCTDPRKVPILDQKSSFSNVFDLSSQDCRNRYSQFRKEIVSWSQNKWGTSFWNSTDIAIASLKTKFGYLDKETLQNKMIASALVNSARMQMGRDNRQNVNTKALLSNESDPMTGNGATYFAGASNTFSFGGLISNLFSPFTGTDYYGADVRNKSAVMFNQILQFLPPMRGFAKGLLALCFVFAAASMCFGTPRFIVSWFGMLLVFTLYEPLSTILYESMMLFTTSKETVDAFQSLRNDPLILSGAAIIDDNLARIQAVYFALQIGVTLVCAVGGMSIFMRAKNIGSGLSDSIVSRAVSYVQIARSLPVSNNPVSNNQFSQTKGG